MTTNSGFNTGQDRKLESVRLEITGVGLAVANTGIIQGFCLKRLMPIDGKSRVAVANYEQAGDEGTTREWRLGKSSVFLGFGTSTYGKKVIYLQIWLQWRLSENPG